MFNFKKIFKVVLPLFIVFFSVQPVFADDTILNDMDVQTIVNEDGSASIKEVWDMDVYEGTEVYKILDNMGESEVEDLKVKDDLGHQYTNIGEWNVDASFEEKTNQCGIVQDGDHYELCFGIGEYGKRKYTFTYTITNFVKQYTDAQGFNYAFFSDMDLAPHHAKVTLSSSHSFSSKNSAIWGFGYEGTVQYVDGKVVMESTSPVDSHGKVQLLMQLENGMFQSSYKIDGSFENVINDAKKGSDYTDDDYYGDGYYSSFKEKDNTGWIIELVAIIASIGGVIIAFVAGYFVKKSKEGIIFNDHQSLRKKDDISMFRDIPCQKDIFQFYYLARKCHLVEDKDKGGLIAAILLRWIQKGYIQFEKREEKGLFKKKEGFSIDLRKDIPTQNKVEEELLGFFKKAAGSNGLLETKEFEKWSSKHYEDIDEWFDDAEEIIQKEYIDKKLINYGVTTTKYLGMNIKRDVLIYDASIREEMEHVIGLKKFLEEMSLIDEKEVIEVKMWEEYLIFASILGIADKVQKQLGRLCPTFDEQSEIDTVYTMYMVHMFCYDSYHAVEAARSAGMGGSASFGGGGSFSGGGGGGVR